jgi:hypothetical protein
MTTNSNSSTSNNSNNSEHGQGLVCFILILFIMACFLLVASYFVNGNTVPVQEMESGWQGLINTVNALNVKPF